MNKETSHKENDRLVGREAVFEFGGQGRESEQDKDVEQNRPAAIMWRVSLVLAFLPAGANKWVAFEPWVEYALHSGRPLPRDIIQHVFAGSSCQQKHQSSIALVQIACALDGRILNGRTALRLSSCMMRNRTTFRRLSARVMLPLLSGIDSRWKLQDRTNHR
jgi:hypothetical protein